MNMTVDAIIKTYETARAEHRRVFSRGIAAAELTSIQKANDAIGNARELAMKFLKITLANPSNDTLIEKLQEQSAIVAQANRESDIQKAQTIWTDLEPGDIRSIVRNVCKKSNSVTFPEFDEFVKITNLDNKSFYNECLHVHTMYIGKWAGRWELSWDMFPNDDVELYPIQLTQVSMKETSIRTFPSLLSELGLFKSSSEAKKNGWNKPLETGDFFFKKKTYILRVTE